MKEKKTGTTLEMKTIKLENGNTVAVALHGDRYYFNFYNKELDQDTKLRLSKDATSAMVHILFNDFFTI